MTIVYFRKGMILGVICLFIGASFSPIIASIESNDVHIINNSKNNEIKKWTWMFYSSADCYAGNPFADINTQNYDLHSGKQVNILVLEDSEFGPAKIWNIDENGYGNLLKHLGEINLADGQTFEFFLEYVKEKYPSERYLLSMYGHGGAWLGACPEFGLIYLPSKVLI